MDMYSHVLSYTWHHERRFSLGTMSFNVLDIGDPNASNVNISIGMELFQADRSTPPLNWQTTDNSEIGIDSEISHAGRKKRLGKLVPAGSGACLPERDFTHLSHLVRALCSRDEEVMVNVNDLAWVCLATQNSSYI